ncbi:MAG: serine hydrolase domain-containing protein [Nocardioidaceae bacterium]
MTAVLDSTAAKLLDVLAREQAEARLPSLIAGVVRDGELVWWDTRGRVVHRDEDGRPNLETQYRIGSITKTMTAVLIMQLRDLGLLDLSDPLGMHLPGVAYGDRSIRQLLSHSSGMQAEPPGSWWERSPGVDFDALSRAIGDGRVVLPSGRQHHYSNLAYGLLGEVVARLRDSSWEQALHTHLLDPLGMTRTTYFPRAPAAEGFSVNAFAGTLTDEPTTDTLSMAPAGQLWSTLSDLTRYAALLAGTLAEPAPERLGSSGLPEPQAIISTETLTEMCIVQSGTPEEGLQAGYGLGVRLVGSAGRTLIGHTGSMPGFLAGLLVDRGRRTGAVCLANGTAGMRCEGLPLELVTILEHHEPALPAEWMPAVQVVSGISEVLGLWHWGEVAHVLTYAESELRLALVGDARPARRYRPIGPDRFVGLDGYHTGETLRVVRDDEGE